METIMSDLLKEAIADAKAVRETALQNAKMALEEAFTPHLKNMLSAKLSEDDIDEMDHEDDMARDMDMDDEEDDDNPVDINIDADGTEDEGYDMSRDDEDEMEKEGVIEVNGVKYAPVQEAEHGDEDKDEENEELDLESVIKELELEISDADGDLTEAEHEDEEDEKNESVEVVTEEDDEDDEEDKKEKQDEQSTSSGIGKGTGVKMASASDEEDPQGAKYHESVEKLGKELKEYKEAVMFLKDKLHEVNILNAKLLFTNRLFKEFVLSNDQKMKIVENFDRAQTTREIKLVYSTLAESFQDRNSVKKKSIKETASRMSGGTAPKKKIISEEDNVANRFKKLAGILKD